jgi:outer membrane receptor protein involved in Fe transport
VVAGPTAAAVFGVGGALNPDFFSRDIYLNKVPVNVVDNYGGSAQINWGSGPLSVTSITSYRKLENFVDQDVDFSSADVVNETRDQRVKTFTQEVRIASDFDGPINFLLGGFFFDEKINQNSGLSVGANGRSYFTLLARGATGNPGFTFNSLETPTALGVAQNSIFSTGPLISEVYSMDNQSWSIFGTVDFEPFDGLVLTGGFNYTDDKKDFAMAAQSFDELSNINLVDRFITLATAGAVQNRTQFLALPAANQAGLAALATNPCTATSAPNTCNPFLGLAPLQFQPPFLTVPNAVESGKTRDDDFSYTLRAAYEFSPNVNAYFSYATGFKASSINLSRDSRPSASDFTPGARRSTILAPSSPISDAGLAVPNLSTGSRFAGPENAEVWEVGVKASWPGLSVNLALFDQTLKGFQSLVFTGTGFQLNNAGKQSVKGFELDTRIQPTDNLVFTFAATYLDPLFVSFTESPTGDLTGLRPGGIPSWNLSTSATHTTNFASGHRLISRIDYSHESNTRINNGLPTFGPNNFKREVNLVNASMTFAMENGLELGVWARNLLDDEYMMSVFDSTAQAGSVSGYPSAPRTFGALARIKF